MDLDSAYIEPLIDDWLDGLKEVVKQQENLVIAEDKFYMPFVGRLNHKSITIKFKFQIIFLAIPIPIINAIFKITQHLELGPDAKYIAIHLYDKFMCNYFWEVYKAESEEKQTENSWARVCKRISNQSKLYLMSCLLLASKMDSHSTSLGISQVLNVLQWIDKNSEYTHSTVFLSEFKVFKLVGFKIPICTPVSCIEILLAATGLGATPNIHDLAISLLDLVYLQREKLYSHLQCLTQGHIAKTGLEKRNLMALESNVLFLGASIILCGTFFLLLDSKMVKAIALKLSEFVEVKDNDIWNMANILLMMAIQE